VQCPDGRGGVAIHVGDPLADRGVVAQDPRDERVLRIGVLGVGGKQQLFLGAEARLSAPVARQAEREAGTEARFDADERRGSNG
jgi:hypothetical protein